MFLQWIFENSTEFPHKFLNVSSMAVYHRIITGGGTLRERKDLMKSKKHLVITAALAVTVLAGGSLAILAAESAVSGAEIVETEMETTALTAEETEAEPVVLDAEVIETEPETTALTAEETEAEPVVLDAEVIETEPETAALTEEVDDADYSYHVGQQSSVARNDAYEALPEGGTKEDAEEFYETYEIGGGAWANGAYDESLKSGYGYAEGQQRAAQYVQDGDDDAEYKAGYSYSVGRQNYMDNYPNFTK